MSMASSRLQRYVAAFTFGVESWIVCCDLRREPLGYTQRVAHLPGDVQRAEQRGGGFIDNILAGGIAIDPRSKSLCFANSIPGVAAAISRMPTDPARSTRKATLWLRRSGYRPSGRRCMATPCIARAT